VSINNLTQVKAGYAGDDYLPVARGRCGRADPGPGI
jgi:hypothetical protein